jgi:hypothetical protein
LHFGYFWSQIRPLIEEHSLDAPIEERRREIAALKEYWRPFIEKERVQDLSTYQSLERALAGGELSSSEEGFGGAYFLRNEEGKPLFVIKPVDEDILCLNNRKGYASPFNERRFRVREEIPLYRSVQTDVLASDLAELVGLSQMTPKTFMAIIKDDHFYDLHPLCSYKEKLCSVQFYIPESQELFNLLRDWIDQNWSEEAIEAAIDQRDFEDLNILIWLLYDTDAHTSNFLAYEKEPGLYGLKKIDNSLSLPEKNRELSNSLSLFPNSTHALSLRARKLIAALPLSAIATKFNAYNMGEALEAFQERAALLQQLATQENLPIREIDFRLSILSH